MTFDSSALSTALSGSFFLIAFCFLFLSGWRGPIKTASSGVSFVCFLSAHMYVSGLDWDLWAERLPSCMSAGGSRLGLGLGVAVAVVVEEVCNGWRFTIPGLIYPLVYQAECPRASSSVGERRLRTL
ncbi:hypothetical protein F5144DRAFT_177235 [Chaetomium tenue]|uniref:Uncharacterized protein n=1 Tax=Chaetomium tenue TaxID=1854479 RepID=A0ACB7PBB2_9PEZI|nr:hypothetical protein F5144DRAFT_177235 [Chaetomium globosum]